MATDTKTTKKLLASFREYDYEQARRVIEQDAKKLKTAVEASHQLTNGLLSTWDIQIVESTLAEMTGFPNADFAAESLDRKLELIQYRALCNSISDEVKGYYSVSKDGDLVANEDAFKALSERWKQYISGSENVAKTIAVEKALEDLNEAIGSDVRLGQCMQPDRNGNLVFNRLLFKQICDRRLMK